MKERSLKKKTQNKTSNSSQFQRGTVKNQHNTHRLGWENKSHEVGHCQAPPAQSSKKLYLSIGLSFFI